VSAACLTSRPHGPIIRGVSKRAVYVTAAVILLVAWANGAVSGILATAGVGVIGLLAAWIHPRVRHGRCNGSGEHHGLLFRWRFRKCGRCTSGRLISWGAGHFGADHIQSEYARGKESRAKARDEHRWR